MVLEDAPELHRLLAGLAERGLGVLSLVQSMDGRAAEPPDRPGRLQGELPHLVLLVEAGFDLPDDVSKVLHDGMRGGAGKDLSEARGETS